MSCETAEVVVLRAVAAWVVANLAGTCLIHACSWVCRFEW